MRMLQTFVLVTNHEAVADDRCVLVALTCFFYQTLSHILFQTHTVQLEEETIIYNSSNICNSSEVKC